MIIAAGVYAERKGDAPAELMASFKTDQYGLPFAGGWMDQPAGLVGKMTAARNMYEAVKGWRESGPKMAYWAEKNPQAWKLVQEYLKETKGV